MVITIKRNSYFWLRHLQLVCNFSSPDLLLKDAHEFLSQILDQLKEEIVKVNKQLAQDKEDSRKWSSQISDEEAEIRKPSDHNRIAQIVSNQFDGLPNPTASNFEFEVEHYITCQR